MAFVRHKATAKRKQAAPKARARKPPAKRVVDLKKENAALRRELAQALEQQTATAEVLEVISRSTFDLEPVLDTLVRAAARLCDAEMAIIFRRNGEVYQVGAAVGFSPDYIEFVRSHPHHVDRGSMTGRAALEKRIIQVEDVAADPEYRIPEAITLAGQRTALGVPLLRQDDVVGVIVLARQRVEPFTERHVALVRTFADQAVIAMENARLITETREALARQTATAEVLRVINASPGDLAPVFDAILEKAHGLCAVSHGTLLLYDGEMLRAVAVHGLPEAFAERLRQGVTLSPNMPNRVLLEGARFAHVPDWAEIDDPIARAALDAGIRTTLFLPLRKDGTLLGQISASRREVKPFTDKEIALLEGFAAQAVIAMENARLLGELRQRTRDLEEALGYQTATSDVLKVISRSTFDLEPVLTTVTETATRLCEAEMGFVSRRDGDVFRFITAVGSTPETTADAVRLKETLFDTRAFVAGRETIAGRVVLERRAVQIADITADPDYNLPEAIAVAKIRTILGIPLMREGEPIGTFTLARQRVEPFTERQIELVRTFADQAVIAIENTRLLTEQREALEQQTATAEVLQVINSSPGDLAPVFDAMLDKAMRLCEATFGGLTSYDGERFHTLALRGLAPEAAGAFRDAWTAGPGSYHENLVRGELLVHTDLVANEEARRVHPQSRAVAEIGGARTGLLIALRKDEALLGSLWFYRKEVRPFSDKQIALLQNFAAQAVIAMENARLLDQLRQRTAELARAVDELTATGDVLKVISRSTFDLDAVLQTVVSTAHRLCNAEKSVIFRNEGGDYRCAAVHGLSLEDEARERQEVIQPGIGTLIGRAALRRHAVQIEDAWTEPDYELAEQARAGGLHTMLGVPLMREGEPIGAFGLARTRIEPFTDRQIELITTFADQAVIAIENARLLAEIQQREVELSVTFDNMGDGVAMFDAKHRLAAWNRNFQEMLALPDAFIAGRPSFAEYFRYLAERGEYSADLEAELSRSLEDTERELRLERTRPDGRVIEVRRNAVPGGGFVLIYSDVTERKRAEQAIREARDAAEMALRELQAAQASLLHTQKMAALGQLTAGIAHEIKNPLNFVNNFAALSIDLLDEIKEATASAMSALDADKRAEIDEAAAMLSGNLEKIAEHGRRADGIVRSMLQHSRGGSGDWQATDMNALVEEALNLAYHGARAQDQSFNITLERNLDHDLAPIEVVPQDMTRVFLNLIGNGFYAAGKRSRATEGAFRPVLNVTTRELGHAVEIRVRDNGIGIPPEHRDKLFQPFFTTKPTGEGTGLGLSISYDIVAQQHGGTITVKSEEGQFTEFTVRLPRRRHSAAPAPKDR